MEKVRCRAFVGGWGGSSFGLGLRFTLRAKVKVLLRQEGRTGAVDAGQEPLDEVREARGVSSPPPHLCVVL